MSAYVTIGRNVGAKPMQLGTWLAFASRVKAAVERFAGPVVTSARGEGTYLGVTEETCIFVGACTRTNALATLRQELAVLASEFGQDAIALTVAEPDFVAAEARGAA